MVRGRTCVRRAVPRARSRARWPITRDMEPHAVGLGRIAISKLALVAAVIGLLALLAAGNVRAATTPAVHPGRIGGIAVPSSRVALLQHLAAAEAFGGTAGSASSGGSPGGGTPPLLYGGGPVMHAVTTQVIAWGPSGHAFPSGYVSGFEQYLSDLSLGLGQSTNISSVARQYVDASGSALSSLTNDAAINDTNAYPASWCSVAGASVCLTDMQIVTELSNVISADALSPDINHSYIVLLPPGVDSCFDSSATQCEAQYFCGYHSTLDIGGVTTTYTLVPYTESTYSNASGDCSDPIGPSSVSSATMALDSIGAHELFESATDPVVDAGYTDSSGYEIGDECAWTWGALSSATGGGSYNQLLNGNQYLIQEMWSDQANGCLQGASSTATATVTGGASAVAGSATGFSATLSGDSSSASSYSWSYADSSGTATNGVATGASPQITFPAAGTYTVWATITDSGGGTVTGVTDVSVAAPPKPTAAFGYTTATAVPATGAAVSFSSSSTASSSESITASSWNFGDGTTGTGASAAHTYTTAGTYRVSLTVTQTNGQTDTAYADVTVVDPPSAAISWDATTPTPGLSMTFSAAASAGAGSITGYSWSFGDGGSSTAANPTHSYATTGTYTVSVTVTQTDGLTRTVSRSIGVVVAGPPSVSFAGSATGAGAVPGAAVAFTSTATPGNGSITGYSWSFGDGTTSTAPDPSHTYTTPGTYTVTLTVTQTGGQTATAGGSITVTAPPTASFSASAATPSAGSAVSFSAAATPGAGSIASYSWSFGDGTTSTAADPSHTYTSPGTYTVTLTVTQSNGQASAETMTVTVAGAPAGSSGQTAAAPPSGHGTAATGGSVAIGWLARAVSVPRGGWRIPVLLRRDGSTSMLSAARTGGRIAVTWYAVVRHHRVVVARGAQELRAGAPAHVRVRLTRAGRLLLARSRRIRVRVLASFRSGRSSAGVSRMLTLVR